MPNQSPFRFERHWLDYQQIDGVIYRAWMRATQGSPGLQIHRKLEETKNISDGKVSWWETSIYRRIDEIEGRLGELQRLESDGGLNDQQHLEMKG